MEKNMKPQYASQVPFVPVNWSDRDTITRRVLDIIDASLPQGQQHDAIAHLIKESTKQYWIEIFNNQFEVLVANIAKNPLNDVDFDDRYQYMDALWQKAIALMPRTDSPE